MTSASVSPRGDRRAGRCIGLCAVVVRDRAARTGAGRCALAAARQDPKLDGIEEGGGRRCRQHARADAADGRSDLQLRASSATRRSKRRSTSPASWRRTASGSSATSPACRPDGRRRGERQAGDRARIRHRRHPAGVAEAGRRVPRSDRRRRAGPRRRAQFRDAAAGHGGAGGEEDHGARAPVGHAEAVARRRRGARRRQGVLRARRRLQGRRRLSVHARRQQFQRVVRRSRSGPASCRSSTRSRARARMRRRIRGAAARRSTPWS